MISTMQDIDTVDFIREIMNRPVIWSSKNDKYKNKIITKRMWDEIRQIFPGTREDELKKKWKNLRDTYRKELKKYPKHSDPLRSNADDTYESCWKYFHLMSFTKDELKMYDTVALQEDESNEDTAITNEQQFIEDPIEIKVENQDYSDDESIQCSSTNIGPMRHEVKIETYQEPNDSLLKPTSIVRQENEDTADANATETTKRTRPQDLREQYLEIERKKLKLLESETSLSNKSQDYHFLMSLLPEIERLPIINRLRLRNKFNDILIEELKSVSSSSDS